MTHKGSCHCGNVKFEVDGEIDRLMECNCSICSRKGFLLWFQPREQFTLLSSENDLCTYTFNEHIVQYKFCSQCGCTPFAYGSDGKGNEIVAVNARYLEDIEFSNYDVQQYDGRAA